MWRNSLTGLDRKTLRRWLAVFFLALAIPTGILVYQAYSQLKWEAFHQYRVLAEELAARIDARIVQLVNVEEARSFADYAFLNVAGDPAANFLQRSPLSAWPPASPIPGLVGYFQVDTEGAFTTPLVPPAGTVASTYGIAAGELEQRLVLQQQIEQILSRNRLVQDSKTGRVTGGEAATDALPAGKTRRDQPAGLAAPSIARDRDTLEQRALEDEAVPATMELALCAMLIAIFIGVPLGLYAGLRPDSVGGRTIMTGSIFGFSLPNFWQGLMLIMFFAVILQWLPAGGRGERGEFLGIESSFFSRDGLSHLMLPAINLALFKTSLVIRLTRASVRETINLDYVKFARAKGLRPRRVIGVHVLKNIMIPLVTIIGLEFGSVIAFAVVTETVFAWPGMGKLIIDSIFQLDRPVIVAYLIVIVFLFITINLVVDILYAILDPRVRLSDQKA